MTISINIYTSPLPSELQLKLIKLGENNNFALDHNALNKSGNYYAIGEQNGKILAMRRFCQHSFCSNGDNIKALQACDTLTDIDSRGLGLFSQLWNELMLSVGSNYSFTFNFPNNISYPAYLKNDFKMVNSVITLLLRKAPAINYVNENVYFDKIAICDKQSNWFKHRLKHGLHKKFPLHSYSIQGSSKEHNQEVHNIPSFYSLSLNHLGAFHGMQFTKSLLFSSRPVTYYGFDSNFNGADIYLNAASYDTAIK